jgi:hypothetical protein
MIVLTPIISPHNKTQHTSVMIKNKAMKAQLLQHLFIITKTKYYETIEVSYCYNSNYKLCLFS